MFDLSIFDLFQNRAIRDNQKRIGHVKHKAADAKIDVQALQKDHERLKLLTISLWELLKEHTGMMDADLNRIIEKIDVSDGRRDGKLDSSNVMHNCKSCSHNIPNSSVVCAYCGAPQARKQFI